MERAGGLPQTKPLALPIIWRGIDVENVREIIGAMDETLERRGEGKLTHAITINMDRLHKEKYDRLTGELQIRVAEHLRRVIYPELDRLMKLAEAESA